MEDTYGEGSHQAAERLQVSRTVEVESAPVDLKHILFSSVCPWSSTTERLTRKPKRRGWHAMARPRKLGQHRIGTCLAFGRVGVGD